MRKIYEESLCSGCTHLVLKGVACDWRPGECPYLKAEKQAANKLASNKAIHISTLAVSEEFDAIRSIN
ncbi:MAG: hypothetical protein MI754_13220 [Chromatiales bacterium]|nr:hypothetical protein [Chromatiales bacterium]